MAEHKVVNTTQLESDLTSIANAIREKTGGSDSLAFPNGFAEAIASIVGLPNNITHLATGTYTFASDTIDNTAITHDLGVQPHFFMFVKQGSFSANSSKKRMIFQFYVSKSIGNYAGSLIKGYFSSTSGTTTGAVIDLKSPTQAFFMFREGHRTILHILAVTRLLGFAVDVVAFKGW